MQKYYELDKDLANKNDKNLKNRQPHTRENTKELHGSMIAYIYRRQQK